MAAGAQDEVGISQTGKISKAMNVPRLPGIHFEQAGGSCESTRCEVTAGLAIADDLVCGSVMICGLPAHI